MKTKEFIEAVEILGFKVEREGAWIVTKTISNTRQLKINKNYASVVFFRGNFSSEIDRNLLNLVVGYLNTPKEEREEEKRYYLRLVAPLLKDGKERFYIEFSESDSSSLTFYPIEVAGAKKSIFTESEISQMDITGFEKIEVSE